MLKATLLAGAALLCLAAANPSFAETKPAGASMNAATTTPTAAAKAAGQYATVNGLKIYYEVHGQGRPLVLLHGGLMNIPALGPLLPALAAGRQVVAVELEGHGRTRDLDRPLSLDQMTTDVAGLINQLGLRDADVFGFSMGGAVAMRLASRHAELVRKLVLVSTGYSNDFFYPSVLAQWPGLSAEGLKGTPMETAYLQTAPDPARWPVFIDKMKQMMLGTAPLQPAEIGAIKAPTLLMLGDADLIRPEAAVDMFRLLGGARPDGGMAGLPESRFAVLPGTTHFDILYRLDLLLPMVSQFLDGTPAGEKKS